MQSLKKQIVLVTGNKNKLLEFQQIVKNQIDMKVNDCDLPELQGEPEEIAKEKAKIAFNKLKVPLIVEDTSLCFNAFQGLPGPYIKWFLLKLKPTGLYKMLDGFEDKTAYAQCIISYMSEELKEPILFIGRTPGKIVQPRQKEGQTFGWDPIFQPDGKTQTYAEMEKSEKNLISHRYRAIEQMLKHFVKN
eukprot:TRINITY_DN2589_c0_g1_i1.p1 TRINITY_DN2589_c0_g1~~TRINITY_DN2589_c0_g1_i1.p1  ORF type:complete len:190 (+),score=37.41 TRINITY_DN2589_c0_g1_i1:125-694(+)